MGRVVITGEIHQGKSTLAEALADRLLAGGVPVAGIIARGLWDGDRRLGYDLRDVRSGAIVPLARRRPEGSPPDLTPFEFFEAGLAAGRRALTPRGDEQVIIVDEVGKLELAGRGWAPCLAPLLELTDVTHVWVVRRSCLADVCNRAWAVADNTIVDVDASDVWMRLERLCPRPSLKRRSR